MKRTKRVDFSEGYPAPIYEEFSEVKRLQKINNVLNKKLDETNLQAIELLGENTYLKELLTKLQGRIVELETKLIELGQNIY